LAGDGGGDSSIPIIGMLARRGLTTLPPEPEKRLYGLPKAGTGITATTSCHEKIFRYVTRLWEGIRLATAR
jgi:hypothetical protein